MAGWRGGQRRRDPVSAPKPAAGNASSSKPGWHGKSTTTEGPRRDAGLWLKRFLASGAVLAILFLLVTILLWRISPTPLAILSVHSHPADLNFVIPARPGANLNAGIQSQKLNSNYLKVVSKAKNAESNLSVQLDDIVDFRHGGPDKNVVLICIAAQGVVNGKGEPCLLDAESKPFDETTWKSLKELFQSLVKRVAPSNGTHVVVFLDSGSAETDWSMGWLRDDFKDRLHKTVENAVDVLPKNWHLVHVRGTADLSAFARTGRRVQFADVLGFGLRGAANGTSGKQQDDKITLSEMIAFIESETGVSPDVWPELENARNTVNLCWAEKLGPNDKPKPLMIGSVPDKLRELWMLHHELEEKLPWRRRPWDWARFEWQLLRAERAWLATDASADKIIKEASIQAEKLRPLLGTTQAIKPPSLDDTWKKFFDQLNQTTNLDAMPKGPPGDSSAAALALLLNRDVRGSYSETTGAKNEGNSAIAKLIRLRRDADTAVWPNDFRAESIVRYQADRIDEKRRALEDLAFVGGGEKSWEQIRDGIEKVRQEYDVPISKSDDFAKRLSQRDRLFARLPWLFQWAELSNAKDDLRQLAEIWNEAAEQMRSFERGVSDPLAASDWEKWDAACGRFEELHKNLVANAKLLSTTSKDSPRDYVRRVRPYLATPLVSGLTRKDLLDRLIKDANAPATKDKNDDAEIRPDPSFVSWKSHPLSVMLKTEIKVSRDDDATRLEKLPVVEQPSTDEDWWQAGDEVRQSLKLQPKTHWSALLEKQPANPQDLTENYRSLVKYDGQKRAVAIALCGGDVPKNETPEKVLDRLNDLQVATYHDWRVRRAILDFYGPTESKPGSEPFYKHHAKFWLGELDKPGVQEQNFSQGLSGRRSLESWVSVSEPLLSVTVRPPTLDFIDGEPKTMPVEVTIAVPAMGDLRPVGAVAVDVQAPSQPGSAQLSERVAATDLLVASGNSSPWKKPFAVDAGPLGNSAVTVRAFFRGHTALNAEVVRTHTKTEPPVERDIPPPEPTPPDATVIVKGRSPQKLWLMVVLDCSLSMEERMRTPDGGEASRFDVAKTALKTMLETLVKESEKTQCELHIGLIAYGYRVGLMATNDIRGAKLVYADPEKKALADEPPILDADTFGKDNVRDLGGLDPSLDVGVLVPIKNERLWNEASYLQMKGLIDRRSAIGITPLYLSIVRAADHMKFLPNDAPKLILVITDGVDNQETLGDPAKRAKWGLKGNGALRTGEIEAKRAIAGPHGPDVRIVGIGIPKPADASVTVRDGISSLRRFCERENEQDRSVREFIQTHSGEELAKKITVAIPPVTFRIKRAEGAGDPDQFASPFGNQIKIENAAGKKFHIEVTRELEKVQQALATTEANKGFPLTIHGGEQFELLYIDKLKKLVFHRCWEDRTNDDDNPASNEKNGLIAADNVKNKASDIRDVRNLAGKKWHAALLTPKVEGGTRRFRVAFRPENENEPPARPTLVRAVITPLKDGGNGNVICPYFFESADVRFEPKQSVPVLEFVATDWNPEWTEANLSIWLRAPGDEATESGGITIARDLLKEAGKDPTVPMTGGGLSISIGKQETVGSEAVITIQQKWDKGVRLPNIENLPILQVDPGSKGFRRLVRVAGQQVIYKFKFPLAEVGRTAYQLRVLDPATLPEAREQETPVKKLRWEKIDVDK